MAAKKGRGVPLHQLLQEQQYRDGVLQSLFNLFQGSVDKAVVKEVAESLDYDLESAATALSQMASEMADPSSKSAQPAHELAAIADDARKDKLRFKTRIKAQKHGKHSLQEFWAASEATDSVIAASVAAPIEPVIASRAPKPYVNGRVQRPRTDAFTNTATGSTAGPAGSSSNGNQQARDRAPQVHTSNRSQAGQTDRTQPFSATSDEKASSNINLSSKALLQAMFVDASEHTITQGTAACACVMLAVRLLSMSKRIV